MVTVLNKWYYDLFLKFQNPCIHMTTILVLGNQLALNDGCTTNDYHLWPSLPTSHEKNKWESRQGKSDIALVSPSGLPAFTRHHSPTVFRCLHPTTPSTSWLPALVPHHAICCNIYLLAFKNLCMVCASTSPASPICSLFRPSQGVPYHHPTYLGILLLPT